LHLVAEEERTQASGRPETKTQAVHVADCVSARCRTEKYPWKMQMMQIRAPLGAETAALVAAIWENSGAIAACRLQRLNSLARSKRPGGLPSCAEFGATMQKHENATLQVSTTPHSFKSCSLSSLSLSSSSQHSSSVSVFFFFPSFSFFSMSLMAFLASFALSACLTSILLPAPS